MNMTKIATFVFFDLETTGLPHLEKNKTKIVELCFVAALRSDIESATAGSAPYISKLTILFNPQKPIQQRAVELTGISNDMLKNAPLFEEKVNTILTFLEELPKPVCLVAHNGHVFDFKIFLTEFSDACKTLPTDLLCADSIKAFKSILKNDYKKNYPKNASLSDEDWMTLDISKEDWDSIDLLCSSFANMAEDSKDNKNIQKKVKSKPKQESYTLTSLYKRLLNKDIVNAHRAENDCMMLLECVVAVKEFLQWTDCNCQLIHTIEPLNRNKFSKQFA